MSRDYEADVRKLLTNLSKRERSVDPETLFNECGVDISDWDNMIAFIKPYIREINAGGTVLPIGIYINDSGRRYLYSVGEFKEPPPTYIKNNIVNNGTITDSQLSASDFSSQKKQTNAPTKAPIINKVIISVFVGLLILIIGHYVFHIG